MFAQFNWSLSMDGRNANIEHHYGNDHDQHWLRKLNRELLRQVLAKTTLTWRLHERWFRTPSFGAMGKTKVTNKPHIYPWLIFLWLFDTCWDVAMHCHRSLAPSSFWGLARNWWYKPSPPSFVPCNEQHTWRPPTNFLKNLNMFTSYINLIQQ